jgi:hypothetical protein
MSLNTSPTRHYCTWHGPLAPGDAAARECIVEQVRPVVGQHRCEVTDAEGPCPRWAQHAVELRPLLRREADALQRAPDDGDVAFLREVAMFVHGSGGGPEGRAWAQRLEQLATRLERGGAAPA